MSPRLSGRRGLAVVAVAALLLAGTAAVTGAIDTFQQPSGDEVLDRVEQRYESAASVSTTATVTVENDTASRAATVEMVAAEGNRSRVIVRHDGEAVRAGTNGTVAWYVGPNRSGAWPVDTLERRADQRWAEYEDGAVGDSVSPQGTPTTNASNVTATLVGTPTIDGTSTYEVELTHPNATATTTLWVAQNDYRVVRAVATDGTNRTVVDVQSTAFNVSVHESTFKPPADRVSLATVDSYDTFDAAQSATDLDLPSLDATFVESTVTVRQGETIAGQHYRVDGTNVTVVSTTVTDRFAGVLENASTTDVDGRTVNVTEHEGTAIAVWTEDGVTTAVVVEGDGERAVAVAERL